jgi:serine/threonine protein kinase
VGPLGEGGMGEVYNARDAKLNRDVAIKVLPGAFAADHERVARFEREAQVLAALDHPNIVPIHDFGTSNGITYAVMPLLNGETLRERLARGAIPTRRAIEYGAAIASALAAAHEKGIVHRDLKPDNVFLTSDERVMLLDFGLARPTALGAAGDTSTVLAAPTIPGTVLGTVGYMAPEQVRGGDTDARSDIFAFGALLYEMVTGRRAFNAPSPAETMNAIVHSDPPWRPSDECPPALQRLIERCLEKRPAARFQSTSDLAFALQQISSSPSTSSAAPSPPRSGRSLRQLLWAVGAIVLVVAGFTSGRWTSDLALSTFRFERLTFRPGNILQARFTPDGGAVVYGASWEGAPPAVFTVRATGGESQPLGLEQADIAAVSVNSELAIIDSPSHAPGGRGTLARVPLGGGAPRQVLEDVFAADWDPAGRDLAVVRRAPNGNQRVEYPIDHVLYESPSIDSMRLSPDGKRVAFIVDSHVMVLDTSTAKVILTRDWGPSGRAVDLAWAPSGDGLYVVAGPGSRETALRRIDLDGHEKVLFEAGGVNLLLHDVASNGDILVERATSRRGMSFRGRTDEQERDVSWLDGSQARTLSDDGAWVLFGETLQGAGPRGDVYIRKTDGSLPIRLGDGDPLDLSRDGKWVLALTRSSPRRLVLLPTGPGVPRTLDTGALEPNGGIILPPGDAVAFGSEPRPGDIEFHEVDLRSGTIRPLKIGDDAASFVTDRSVAFGDSSTGWARILPDRHIETISPSGARRVIPGAPLPADEDLVAWATDGYLYTAVENTLPARLFRIDVRTGDRTPWRTLMPADPAGVTEIRPILVARDGVSYVYSYRRVTSSDLFLVHQNGK